ncbi:Transcriptional regulator, MerR family [Olavius algarvensis associated proteobacterium Delta 3]|nr:Transcriptional regulator, MerR family [Olavius algarvensis associated proteobacterium Delta 3]CAB5108157.1 Transcriptional regulator, MerR family [Olavius algarvensis associated proteobacterium Delta 3]
MADIIEIPNVELPDKIYFKIGEASRIAGVQPHVLRFWETEFKRIKPKRTPSGQRMYRRQDVELILIIKHLLHVKKFTIEGAKKYLKAKSSTTPTPGTRDTLKKVREELVRIRELLR